VTLIANRDRFYNLRGRELEGAGGRDPSPAKKRFTIK